MLEQSVSPTKRKTYPHLWGREVNKLSHAQMLLVSASILIVASFFSISTGCSRPGGVVGETDEYSYEDVAAQIRAEDEANEAEQQERER